MDVLNSALEKFHFSSTLYCAHCTNRSPWGIRLGASRSAQFHAVRSGRCWVRVERGELLSLEAGDFVVLPHGDAHDVVDARKTRAVPAHELLANHPRTNRWIVGLGENGALSELVCAGFLYAGGVQDPLLSFLPRVIHLRACKTASLEPLLVLAEREMRAPGRGTEAMLARIAEMLMVESVRTYVGTLSPGQGGWLGALHDPKIAAAIHAIHEEPARRWPLRDLAERAGMSRTSLATRFHTLVGVSMQAYVTRFRMTIAASLLEDPRRPNIARIAETVGYSSEAAFSRAFSREMGVAPTKLRPLPQVERTERSA